MLIIVKEIDHTLFMRQQHTQYDYYIKFIVARYCFNNRWEINQSRKHNNNTFVNV